MKADAIIDAIDSAEKKRNLDEEKINKFLKTVPRCEGRLIEYHRRELTLAHMTGGQSRRRGNLAP